MPRRWRDGRPRRQDLLIALASQRHGLRLPLDEHAVIFSPPRGGKTGWLARVILHYPGPVVSTTTKHDVFELASGIRATMGPVHVFNPQGIGGVPSTFRWNPLDGCQDPAAAIRRAHAFANDEREAGHYREVTARLAEMARLVGEASDQVEEARATAARQAAIIDSLEGLDQQVAALATGLANLADCDGHRDEGEQYRPASASQWWKLSGPGREAALPRLRAWVEQVYRPGYGHLAAALGRCWEEHPLCLYGLDWLMELWSARYLVPERKAPALASQAEWQTRLLPALAEQMYIETTRCRHRQRNTQKPNSGGSSRLDDRELH